jgi:hypothetical protein
MPSLSTMWPEYLISDWAKLDLALQNEKLFSFKHFKDQTHMRLMLSFRLREDQDIVNIDNNKLPDIR